MASENEKRETVADIVAEMRGREFDDPHLNRDGMIGARRLASGWADRIEAAWKRQEQCYLDQMRDAVNMIGHERFVKEHSQVGNAAATREALVAVKKSIDDMGISSLDCDPTILMASITQVCARLSARIERALSAPARSCDVGTAEEQAERHSRFCISHGGLCKRCPAHRRTHNGCVLAWAQMPYGVEEGGAK